MATSADDETPASEPVVLELLDTIFSDGGLLSQKIEGYKERPAQVEFSKAIAECLLARRHFLGEAPTGTGKSFAAGIPAAILAALEGSTVVYVTANHALQDQLDRKDMPFIASLIDELASDAPGFRTVVLKGMSNYLCKAELAAAQKDRSLPSPWNTVIPAWASTTKVGDKAELAEEPAGEVWSKVSTTSEDCLRKKCDHFKDCFVFKQRERAQSAHLVVTNYHLYFMDRTMELQSEGNVSLLPPHDIVIFDEAHEATEIAMDFRGHVISPGRWARISKFLNRMAQDGDREAASLREALELHGRRLQEHFSLLSKEGLILELPTGFDGDMTDTLVLCLSYAEKKLRLLLKAVASGVDDAKQAHARLAATVANTERAIDDLKVASFGLVKETTKDEDTGEEIEHSVPGSAEKLGVFPENRVYFFQTSSRGVVSLACKVMDTQEFFQTHVFDSKTAVFISATLSAMGKMTHLVHALGLSGGSYTELIVDSPFDGGNVLVAVPPRSEFPNPDDPSFQVKIAEAVKTIFLDMPFGGMMCLFTSYRNLTSVAQALARDRRLSSVPTFVQGQMGKMQIIKNFMEAHARGEKAIILATSSFWQGVDIPGQALSVVVIDKLPFPSPDDPIMWHMERTTRSAFVKYAVVRAVIALKQGVGRLIRRVDDYGAIVVLDPRARDEKTRYFKAIDSAFPAGCFISEDLADVATFLSEKRDERE